MTGQRGLRSALLCCVALFLICVPEVSAQYGGPSLLSRGGNLPGRRGRAPVDFSFFVTANARYETGLISPEVAANALPATVDSAGGGLDWGVYGGHDWKRQSLGLDYRGDYRYDSVNQYFNGTNQALALEYFRILTRHTRITARETGGTSNRAFGGFVAPAFSDVGRYGIPLNEVFDVRTRYSQTDVGFGWQRSARMTLRAGVTAFFVKRDSASLTNSQGYGGNAGIAYRLNPRDTLGFEYQFVRFEFPHVFSTSDANIARIRFSRLFTKSLSGTLALGAFAVHSTGSETIQLSPAVAAILGRTTGTAFFRRTLAKPSYEGTINYLMERGRAYATVTQGVSPGNGIYLTTTITTVNGGYSYAGIRKASIGVSGGWSRSGSVSLSLVPLNTWQVGAGGSYALYRHINATSQVDWRTFNTSATTGRSGWVMTFGIGYTSSTYPLSIW